MTEKISAELTLGPVLYNWKADAWRDFYFKIADEAPVDTVVIGETICYKRAPFFEPLYGEVMERLEAGGKTVVFSTLAEVMLPHDRRIVESICSIEDHLVEVNDASGLYHLTGKPHNIGPLFNTYNEEVVKTLAKRGAKNFCVPHEMRATAIEAVAKEANALGCTVEVQVFGRQSLALSARCYHARAHDRIKDTCQFVCEDDPDGLNLRTLEGQPFLTINGVQVLSNDYVDLIAELPDLARMGVARFRLSPQNVDMVAVAKVYRAAMDGDITAAEGHETLKDLVGDTPLANGFFYQQPGYRFIDGDAVVH
ncbi:collagenase-like PrtC family protease [Rhodobium orientis]|uniref:ubiquinone anaerobic biosynthesis protein UbiV n=1 Tax=Rhodobium orientis TaxID=34017 RepID=UPI0017CA5E2C|nr:U32 family peptidase [Rhodobium orientis]MBB4304841.1 collagenase-like PrtC family protease [Rhodobium orientis]